MVLSKRWVLGTNFVGKPTLSNFKLVEEDIPHQLDDGEILCEALYLTVDPYMRIHRETGVNEGDTMVGEQIAKVIASKNPDYPVGRNVRLSPRTGWRTHTLVKDPSKEIVRMPDMDDLPLSLVLGVMGMPGMTAFFGFLEICNPLEGETVLVSDAAGAVGSLVGQIAKIKGCKVIGFAGTKDKCRWLKDDLGFDHVFNYKEIDVDTTLKQAAPEGIDCYFDNVGGEFSMTALNHMKKHGRVSICGCISTYNNTEAVTGPIPFMTILGKQLKVEGFLVYRWFNRWLEGETKMKKWIKEGKIKYREHMTEGFENMPKAFMELFEGTNNGKAIVKV